MQVQGGTPSRCLSTDRAQVAARAIVADARRGAAYATKVEQHLRGLGVAQLRNVVGHLFYALAEHAKTVDPQQHPTPTDTPQTATGTTQPETQS